LSLEVNSDHKSYDFGQVKKFSLGHPLLNPVLSESRGNEHPNIHVLAINIHDDTRPGQSYALGARYVQTSSHSLGNASTPLFGDRGDDGDYSVLNDSARIEILLSEAPASFSSRHDMLAQFSTVGA
jgi:hypothetical protein